ncbi:PREDICTED: lachesin isoform X2 [Rhagoletis zephyria]|nr:PREDICTED: lachesin isoform X2 [Rhagoletis zephyria]XP_017472465.1 PREDICTED: lachesin isoform X2 [Rhagoletis zephyria]XP_036330630.1 lachesin isoform X2 [Rhagoletis pomonella]
MANTMSSSTSVAVAIVVCLWTLMAGSAQAQRTPTISYITQEQIKDIGGTVEFDCSVQYASDYQVLWSKTDTDAVFLSTGSTLVIKDSRFSLRHDPNSSTYKLQIKDIQETDAGTYTCQVVISVVHKVSANVKLSVRRPPVISDNSTQSVVASEGSEVQMECYASGYPTPTISWRRENNAILPTDSATYVGNILKIKSVKKEDRGTYYCVADNGVSKGDRRNINVEVEFAPVITVPRPRLGQALQYDMDLECHIEAYPPPAIVWLKDDIQLSNNQHYSISHFATADEYSDSTLRVITIEKRQYGDYVCKAVNKLGQAESRVNLFETVIPVCPPACGQAYYGGAEHLAATTFVLLAMLGAAVFAR